MRNLVAGNFWQDIAGWKFGEKGKVSKERVSTILK